MMSHSALSAQQASGFFTLKELHAFVLEHMEVFLLIALFIGYQLYQNKEQEMVAAIVESPRQSDFLYVDYFAIAPDSNPQHRYIPLKVLAVNDETVRLKVGNIAHSTPVSPREHAKFDKAMSLRNYYRQGELSLSLTKIRQLYRSGVIYNARRPNSIYIDGWIVIPKHEIYLEP